MHRCLALVAQMLYGGGSFKQNKQEQYTLTLKGDVHLGTSATYQ